MTTIYSIAMVVLSRSELQRMQDSVAEGVVTKQENKRVSALRGSQQLWGGLVSGLGWGGGFRYWTGSGLGAA